MGTLYELLTLLVTVHLNLYGCFSLTPQAILKANCSSCNKSSGSVKDHVSASGPVGESTAVLALGEPCGVYTLPCARGLRCLPPTGDQSPLQALLQGRGTCRSIKSSFNRPPLTESQPPISENTEKGPCRRLLNTVLQDTELTVIQSDQDIYIPNCDKQGFFRKKQCRSSRGMQRGRCWCVDEKGNNIPSRTRDDGSVICNI